MTSSTSSSAKRGGARDVDELLTPDLNGVGDSGAEAIGDSNPPDANRPDGPFTGRLGGLDKGGGGDSSEDCPPSESCGPDELEESTGRKGVGGLTSVEDVEIPGVVFRIPALAFGRIGDIANPFGDDSAWREGSLNIMPVNEDVNWSISLIFVTPAA